MTRSETVLSVREDIRGVYSFQIDQRPLFDDHRQANGASIHLYWERALGS